MRFLLFGICVYQVVSQTCDELETSWSNTCRTCNPDSLSDCNVIKHRFKDNDCCNEKINNYVSVFNENGKQSTSKLLVNMNSDISALAFNSWLGSNSVTSTMINDIKTITENNDITDGDIYELGRNIQKTFANSNSNNRGRRLFDFTSFPSFFTPNELDVKMDGPKMVVDNGQTQLTQDIITKDCFTQTKTSESDKYCVKPGATCPPNWGYYKLGECFGCNDPLFNGKHVTKYHCYKGQGLLKDGCKFEAVADIGGQCLQCPDGKKAFGGRGFGDDFAGCMGDPFASDCSGWKGLYPEDTNFPDCPGDGQSSMPDIGVNGSTDCWSAHSQCPVVLGHPHVNMLGVSTSKCSGTTCTNASDTCTNLNLNNEAQKCKYYTNNACVAALVDGSHSDGWYCDCHPADSVVRVQHPCDAGMCVSPRRMDELKIGDLAEYDYGKFEPIIAFAHKTNAMNHYFRFIGGNNTLEISSKHYLYANGQEILPSNIKIGDTLSDGTQVSRIEHVYKKGAYHPHTASWTLIVNNLKTSQNTFVMKNEHLNDALQYVLQYKFSVLYAIGVPEERIDGSMWWYWQTNLKKTLESLPEWVLDHHWAILPIVAVVPTVYTLPELMWGSIALIYFLNRKHIK